METPSLRFICVCEHCLDHNKNATIEFNFKDQSVYYICENCKKMNMMTLKSREPNPYPKTRLMR